MTLPYTLAACVQSCTAIVVCPLQKLTLNLISTPIPTLTGDGAALACGALCTDRLPGAAAAARLTARAHAHAAGADTGHHAAPLRPPLRRACGVSYLQA